LANEFIWISVDETTDMLGRYVANLLVEKMDIEKLHKPFIKQFLFTKQFSPIGEQVSPQKILKCASFPIVSLGNYDS
jgi:hypothetical protein